MSVQQGFAILVTLCGVMFLSPVLNNAQAQEPVDLELVLAADGSGSIDDAELRLQREGYARAVRNPRVLEALTGGIYGKSVIAYVEWGSAQSQHTIVDWTVIDGPDSAAAFGQALVDAPRQAWGYNSISNTIVYLQNLLETNPFRGLRRLIDFANPRNPFRCAKLCGWNGT